MPQLSLKKFVIPSSSVQKTSMESENPEPQKDTFSTNLQQNSSRVTDTIQESQSQEQQPILDTPTITTNSQENLQVEIAQTVSTVDQQNVPSVAQQKTSATIQPQTAPQVDADKAAVTFRLKQNVSDLTTALLDKHPSLPTLLREIHKTIRSYPEQVTILSEEELNGIFKAYEQMSQITLAASQTAKKSSDKSLKSQIKNLGTAAF